MKITTQQIRRLIKEELQNVMNEKEQLDEGAMAAALAFLFAGGAETITIDGSTFTPNSLEQTLDYDRDGNLDGEFPQSMLKVMKGDIESGMVDADNKYSSSDFRLGTQQIAAIASGAKSKTKSPKAGSKTMKGGNIEMQLAQMQTALDTQNPDSAIQMAKTVLENPLFMSLDKAQQEMVKTTAGLAR